MAFPSSAVLDNFNRASLGANWTTPFIDGAALANPNGTQEPGSGSFADGYYNALSGLSSGVIEVYATVAVKHPTLGSESVMVYFLDSAKNGYAVEFDGNFALVYREDTGSPTQIAGPAITLANGDVVGMSFDTATGTITAYQNGVAKTSIVDGAHTGMDRIGVETGNSATIRIDDFGGGAVVTSGNTVRAQLPFMSNGRI